MLSAAIAKAQLRKQAEEKLQRGDVGQRYQFYGNNATIQESLVDEQVTSGGADTGKTLAWLYRLNQLAWHYPGIQLAIIRKEYASMPGTVLQTYQKKIIKRDDGIQFYGGDKHPSQYIYPNGSVIWIGGLDKASKVLSSERDGIYVNQAEEILLADWETLLTRCSGRAGNVPFHFLGGDCNPAAPTHWIKTRAQSGKLKLLEVTHRDNPEIYDPITGELTESGHERLSVLQRLTGANLLRLYHGIWAQPEGAIYDVFDETRHKVKSMPIPHTWQRVVGVDPFGAYICALWLAFDPVNRMLVVYREYYEPFGVTTPEHVKNILRLSGYNEQGQPISAEGAEPIFAWVGGGPSERQARADWTAAGIPLLANEVVDVWSQIDKVYQLLREFRLVITEDCPNLLSEIGSYKRKIVAGQITDTIDHDEQFHSLSALRYAISWMVEPTERQQLGQYTLQIGRY
jgi:PBSX family phage terminase large subunit